MRPAPVDGSVSWPSDLTVTLSGDERVFSGNNLPGHPTGRFPVEASDDAYQYDRNPNSITGQDVAFTLDAAPVVLDTPECAGGSVGYMLTGGYLFNGFDARGKDAVAWEVQDACDGHPQATGVYHYHSVSSCAEGSSEGGHSELLGYAFDGFGIYGHYGVDGDALTNEDLDACHGHTHSIEWDGEPRSMYHYHATYEFPYTVSCFRGDAIQVR
ncbi:MAG TPA: YHYH protein [Actinomycetota bacterium]|nr:YHYH protein [Actinomycetota bacterium]